MKLTLDHLAVAGTSRDAARAYVEDALGLAMQHGGSHAHFGTHNHLMGLANGLYLEAISVDPDAPEPDYPRWFDLDHFTGSPRLTNWICAADHLAGLPTDLGVPVALSRGDLTWQMAVPASGKLPFDNLHPALICWQSDGHPAKSLAPSGAALIHLTLRHPDAEALQARVGDIPNADIRFETGAPAMEAIFDTPHGQRSLT